VWVVGHVWRSYRNAVLGPGVATVNIYRMRMTAIMCVRMVMCVPMVMPVIVGRMNVIISAGFGVPQI
jgi:hypothetical protein